MFFCVCVFFTTVLSHWDFSQENFGCFPRGKPAVTESSYPTYGACWVFLFFHNSLNSDMDYRIFIMRTDFHVCGCTWGMYGHRYRVCTESWLWEKNPLLHQGMESTSAACWSNTLPTELHPHPTSFPKINDISILCQSVCLTHKWPPFANWSL